MSSSIRVGFIGAGKMATALARGIVGQGQVLASAKDLTASCPVQDAALLKPIQDLGCQTTHDNLELVHNSDLIIVAVKPLIVPKVLSQIKPILDGSKIVASIAAGVTLSKIQSDVNANTKVVRVMPNTPCLVQEGTTVFSMGEKCSPEDGHLLKKVLRALGPCCHEVPETWMDAITGISGSGPAYFYIIIEAMADAGVKMGLPRDLAYQLAAQTMVGAGQMILQTGIHPAVLKDDVCSPGGSTITAVDQLEQSGLRSSIIKAVEAATIRCHEMGESE